MRKTKIICTLGPATDDEKILRQLIQSGMNVARLNFSHGTYPEHQKRIETVRRISQEEGRYVAVLLDTKGPEIRTGMLEGNSAVLEPGAIVTLTTKEVLGNKDLISISYDKLPEEVIPGNLILLDDGLIGLEVMKTTKQEVICTVKDGGILGNRKGINIPGITIHVPYMNEKDRADILFGIEQDVDFIAASFVRCKEDVLSVRKILEENNGENIQVISKIENKQGVQNIDDILHLSYGIMIARGDMGVEIPIEDLPGIQKSIIKKCYLSGKVAITATQMLDSMIRNARPTRAEITDVANAVYDGTSALMLSGETAIGKYPIESFLTMDSVAEKTEQDIDYKKRFRNIGLSKSSVANAISHAACMTAHDLGAAAIITVTKSGLTARMISRFRPQCPIIAPATTQKICCQLALSWGVVPVLAEVKETSDEVLDHAVELSMTTHLIDNGDVIVLTGGFPVGVSGTTNMLKVDLVGNVLCEGTGINSQSVSANVFIPKDLQDALDNFSDGSILVIQQTTNEYLPIMKRASGIITEAQGSTSHAAIVGMTLDIPVIVGAHNATQLLKTGTIVTMDAKSGLVYNGNTAIEASH